MVKCIVIDRYYCNSKGHNVSVGDIVFYTKERAKEILSKGKYIEILEVAPEPKAEAEAPIKRTRQPRKKKTNEN
jgi:hypothetical protein